MTLPRLTLLAAATLAFAFPAAANDSEAAIGLGGLELVANQTVSMDSEDLYISQKEVRVRYRYTNHAPRDVELTVSFPVPILPGDLHDILGERAFPEFAKLGFTTTVDGKPVALGHVERAMVGERDVTQRLAQLGWPLEWYRSYPDRIAFIDKLTDAQKAAFLHEGLLLHPAREPDMIEPAWSLVTHVTRRQLFPAGKTVEVTHRYAPLAGGSVGGAFNRQYRQEDYARQRIAQYCVDRDFLAAFDRRQSAGTKGGAEPFYMEHWIHYLLKPGANWRGPIGDFRLVVDKGRADNMVSFCMNGVRKISPTQFEVRRTNYEPDRNIAVLVIEWVKP
ncbi:MAG: DUF4424 family protein [Sphingomonadales bacterium]|nr:DUF4424 family protein [Sphingomonadales bacterium]